MSDGKYREQRRIETAEYLIERQQVPLENRSLFDMLYLTGARISEVVRSVKPEHFNFERSEVTLKTLKRRDNITHRTVVFYPLQYAEIIESVRLQVANTPIGNNVWNISRQKAHKQCVKYFHTKPHSFRHTHAIFLVRDLNLPEPELRGQMGWTHIVSSQPYLEYATLQSARKRMGLEE